MKSMAEIHRSINAHYNKLKEEHEKQKREAKENLYKLYPRIEQIDNEISMLAVTSARKILEEKITPEEATLYMKKTADELKKERAEILEKNNETEFNIIYECNICKDNGYTKDGKKCACYIKKLKEFIALPGEKINVNSDFFKNSIFDNFNLSYYPDEVDSNCGFVPRKIMKMNYAKCVKFANEFTNNTSENILLYGPSGLGKSFLAACIYNRVSQNGYFAMYKSSYKLFEFLEDYKFGRVAKEEYNVVYNSIYDCDLLIIDDFGTEFITSYTQSVFFDLLNTRLMNGKSTIISTNLNFDKLNDIYQERVTSRLQNEFTTLFFCGKDIRSIKNE